MSYSTAVEEFGGSHIPPAISVIKDAVNEKRSQVFITFSVKWWFLKSERDKELQHELETGAEEYYWRHRNFQQCENRFCGRILKVTDKAICVFNQYRPNYGRFVWVPIKALDWMTLEYDATGGV